MPRIVRVPGWLRSSFTASQLSGWPTWIDVGASLSEDEIKRLQRSRKRRRREREANVVQPIQISYSLQ